MNFAALSYIFLEIIIISNNELYVGMVVMGTNLSTEEIVIGIYGGTSWTQITDKFLIGASSTYKVNTTGGSSTHTITTAELPSHNHTVTAAGSISGGAYTFTGSTVTSGNNSANHTHSIPALSGTAAAAGGHAHYLTDKNSQSYNMKMVAVGSGSAATVPGWNSGGSNYAIASKGSTVGTGGDHTHTVSTTASTSGSNSANHTHSVTAAGTIAVKTNPTFTGSSATTSNTGSGNSISIVNPYYAVYIWVRTA